MTYNTFLMHPFLQLVLLAMAAIASLYLFLSTKRELQRLERRLTPRLRTCEERGSDASRTIELLDGRVGAIEQWTQTWQQKQEERERKAEAKSKASVLPLPKQSLQSLNQTKRSKVLQLANRGESSYQIADQVGMPRTEVDLLLKVHRCLGGLRS